MRLLEPSVAFKVTYSPRKGELEAIVKDCARKLGYMDDEQLATVTAFEKVMTCLLASTPAMGSHSATIADLVFSTH